MIPDYVKQLVDKLAILEVAKKLHENRRQSLLFGLVRVSIISPERLFPLGLVEVPRSRIGVEMEMELPSRPVPRWPETRVSFSRPRAQDQGQSVCVGPPLPRSHTLPCTPSQSSQRSPDLHWPTVDAPDDFGLIVSVALRRIPPGSRFHFLAWVLLSRFVVFLSFA